MAVLQSKKEMKCMKALWEKYKSILLYVFFGGVTTLTNIAVFYLTNTVAGWGTVLSTCIAWVVSVLVAYGTNRRWVFESQAQGASAVLKEMGSFFFFRLATGALDVLLMYVFVDCLHVNSMAMKLISNVIVIVVNYVCSKMVVFKRTPRE